MAMQVKKIELDAQQKRALQELFCRKYLQGTLCGICAMCQEHELTDEPCECDVCSNGFSDFLNHAKPVGCPAKPFLENEYGIKTGADLLEDFGTDSLENALFGKHPGRPMKDEK